MFQRKLPKLFFSVAEHYIYRVRHIYCNGLLNKYLIYELRCCKKKNSMIEQPMTIWSGVMRYISIPCIIKISKSNLQSASGGFMERTHENFRDKSHSGRKSHLRTFEWVMGSSTDPVFKSWLGRKVRIIKIQARWRSFILA